MAAAEDQYRGQEGKSRTTHCGCRVGLQLQLQILVPVVRFHIAVDCLTLSERCVLEGLFFKKYTKKTR